MHLHTAPPLICIGGDIYGVYKGVYIMGRYIFMGGVYTYVCICIYTHTIYIYTQIYHLSIYLHFGGGPCGEAPTHSQTVTAPLFANPPPSPRPSSSFSSSSSSFSFSSSKAGRSNALRCCLSLCCPHSRRERGEAAAGLP